MDGQGNFSYSIAGYSYIAYLAKNNSDFHQTRILYDFLRFTFSTDGYRVISTLSFVPITPSVRQKVYQYLDAIESENQRISTYFNADLNSLLIVRAVFSLLSLSIIMMFGVFLSFTELIAPSTSAYLSQLFFSYLFVFLLFF